MSWNLPLKDKSFDFYLASQEYIMSKRGLKLEALRVLFSNGIPKYLIGNAPEWRLTILQRAWISGVVLVKQIKNLLQFIERSQALWREERHLWSAPSVGVLALPKISTSSAKRKCDTKRLPKYKGVKLPSTSSCSNKQEKISMTIENKKGERGHPWRSPLLELKYSKIELLQITEKGISEIQILIHSTKGGNPS